jgi:hypothetical protein
MNPNDRLRAAERTLEERLRAASNALREGSADQVDAATGLREIVHGASVAADGQALLPAGRPLDPAAADAPPPGPPRTRLFRASQRLALVVNLLLVVALSVVLVRVAADRREASSAVPATAATTANLPQAIVPASTLPAKVKVPEECLDATELADEVIARLNRKQRGNQLALALRDYSVASQACRREAGR